eukprot:4332478-Amphidinium_carterae.2
MTMTEQCVQYFVGELDDWLAYRQRLIERHSSWTKSHHDLQAMLDDGALAEQLLPPPRFSTSLAAGTRWSPCSGSKAVVVTIGGIYGGSDGPSGLYNYLASVSSGLSFLQVDGGHTAEVSAAVLNCALRWLLTNNPEHHGHVILGGFSMGSSAIALLAEELVPAVGSIFLIAGQSAQTQGLSRFREASLLLIHGSADVIVQAENAHRIHDASKEAGLSAELHILEQTACVDDFSARFVRHHLWHERWTLQGLVLNWLYNQMRLHAAQH